MDLNELEARAKAATQGEWVVGNNWNRAGVTPILFGDGKCFYCQKEGSPNPEREELGVINGKRMLMHWHRRATPINPEHVIETADGYHQITGNYEYEEGGVVRAEDAAYIAAASPQVVLALIEQIRSLACIGRLTVIIKLLVITSMKKVALFEPKMLHTLLLPVLK